jgi:ABC-2 type transport system ATP-binding protein/lipopolysaccharide transport system ATP-binding protein
VVDGYISDVNAREVQAHHEVQPHEETAPVEPTAASPARLGSGEVRVTSVEFLDGDDKPSATLVTGAPCTIRLHFLASEAVSRAVFGIGFLHESGVNVSGPNSGRVGSWPVDQGQGYVDFVVDELLLSAASYRVSAAVVDRGHTYDYADREFDLHVRGRGYDEPGLTRMLGTWKEPVMVPAGVGSDGPKQEIARVES